MRIASLTLFLLICIANLYSQKIHTTLRQRWAGNAWQDTLQETYTYDSRGLVATKAEQRWSTPTATWVNTRQEAFTYFPDSLEQQHITQTWDTIGHVWQNYEMDTFTHSSPHVCSGWLRQIWVNGSWQNKSQFLYTNNKKGFPFKSLWLTWKPAEGKWVNFWRANYACYGQGAIHHQFTQNWDTTMQVWSKERESTSGFYYNMSGKCVKQVNTIRLHNRWRNNGIFVSSYDAQGHKVYMSCKDWVAESKAWMEHWHEDYTNNADGSVNYLISTRWSRSGGEPVSKVMTKYTYL